MLFFFPLVTNASENYTIGNVTYVRPADGYLSANCSGAGYSVFFPQARYLCEDTPVNGTYFAGKCGASLRPDDFNSTQARRNFTALCGCERTPQWLPVCLCPEDFLGSTCAVPRPASCSMNVFSPRAASLVLPRGGSFTLEASVTCRFTNFSFLDTGYNADLALRPFELPARVANDSRLSPAAVRSVLANFTYYARAANFSLSMMNLTREVHDYRYGLQANVYNFFRMGSKVRAILPIRRAMLENGNVTESLKVDLASLDQGFFAGNRLHAELFIPRAYAPGQADVEPAFSIVVDLDQGPPRPQRVVSPRRIIAGVVIVLLLGLVVGWVGRRVWRARRAREKRE